MDGLNNVFADVDSIHKTDLLEVRLRVRAVANIPLTDKVAKRPHFWEVLSSLLINLFVKKDPRFRVSLNVKLTTLGSDPLTKFLRWERRWRKAAPESELFVKSWNCCAQCFNIVKFINIKGGKL